VAEREKANEINVMSPVTRMLKALKNLPSGETIAKSKG